MISDVFLDHSTYAEPPSRLVIIPLFVIHFFYQHDDSEPIVVIKLIVLNILFYNPLLGTIGMEFSSSKHLLDYIFRKPFLYIYLSWTSYLYLF